MHNKLSIDTDLLSSYLGVDGDLAGSVEHLSTSTNDLALSVRTNCLGSLLSVDSRDQLVWLQLLLLHVFNLIAHSFSIFLCLFDMFVFFYDQSIDRTHPHPSQSVRLNPLQTGRSTADSFVTYANKIYIMFISPSRTNRADTKIGTRISFSKDFLQSMTSINSKHARTHARTGNHGLSLLIMPCLPGYFTPPPSFSLADSLSKDSLE